jgi:hypothetical protein
VILSLTAGVGSQHESISLNTTIQFLWKIRDEEAIFMGWLPIKNLWAFIRNHQTWIIAIAQEFYFIKIYIKTNIYPYFNINHVCKRRVWTYLVNSMKINHLTWSSLFCTSLDMWLFGRVPQTGPSVRIGPSARDCTPRRMANLEGSSECAIWN